MKQIPPADENRIIDCHDAGELLSITTSEAGCVINAGMKELIIVLFQIVLVLLLADFVAGIVHWFEDAYVREDTPLIGSFIGRANVIHHHLPRYLTRHNWWQSSWDLLAFSALIVFIAWRLDLLTWQVWLFATISANANEVHKWSHRTRAENRPTNRP